MDKHTDFLLFSMNYPPIYFQYMNRLLITSYLITLKHYDKHFSYEKISGEISKIGKTIFGFFRLFLGAKHTVIISYFMAVVFYDP